MHLNKYLASVGICSRRKAVEIIRSGRVSVNGKKITEPGFKVQEKDQVNVSGEKVVASHRNQRVYILVNKPRDYICTVSDERGRRTVVDLLKPVITQRIYPIGRLDRNTTGVLLMTNDGNFANKLSHPRYEVQKTYEVVLDSMLRDYDLEKIEQGLVLEDGEIVVDAISFIPGRPKSQVSVTLHSGKNHIIKRIFAHLGYEVERLDRVTYAGLTKQGVAVSAWRFLTDREVEDLLSGRSDH
jgi:23S rRNA pseudouridine2605 synthase